VKTSLPTLLAAVLYSGVAVGADDAAYPRARLLLEPTELARPEMGREFVVLDVRSQEQYDGGHVPGARRVDHDAWKEAFGDGDDSDGWSRRIGELGIGRDTKVVLYDDKSMKDAARIWWILRYWGIRDARLLNGGWNGWTSAGLPTSEDPPPPASPVEFKANARSRRLVTKGRILKSLAQSGLQIVDARSEAEFCGTDTRDNKKGGAIPGAKNLEWSDLIDPETQRFRSPREIRRLLAQADIDLDRPTATYCQSGGRASVMAFGLELMGAKRVGNYFRGWNEWGNAPETPVAEPSPSAPDDGAATSAPPSSASSSP
jgi:thiosulfate/3-mercaptopyruvate sulfurtransferase